ncbi:uncharacterized protein B0J16DRAFT_398626 [Fusarium flagelliforme]|uniref:uncharacterized protein n=1 Tax=Fusarium flagelliforme TaxID=2675880 RepID=UPI001E8E0043|nr:uncharacterized protein B0J16DRAFT_398626 [Fusarium flagelliforme]KAH7184998.1 hypothetical protein B0J16DRAFT_398626 [Fusarium flagelliforme]
MTSSEDYSGDGIPEIKSDAYAISGQTLFSVEEYGKKWYERGVEAGLTQATDEAGELASAALSENEGEIIDELGRQVEELERQVEKLEAYKDVAIYAQNLLENIAVNTANLSKFWNGDASYELYRKILELDAQSQASKEEYHRKMDKASGKA